MSVTDRRYWPLEIKKEFLSNPQFRKRISQGAERKKIPVTVVNGLADGGEKLKNKLRKLALVEHKEQE